MNRIIKFRAWDTGNKKMYSCDWLSFIPGGIRFAWVDPNRDEMMITSLKDFELMQFTGLLDKNGKEIYEGDIVKIIIDDGYSFELQQIIFHEAGFKISETIGKSIFMRPLELEEETYYSANLYEIIGNIYETPLLLTPNPTT